MIRFERIQRGLDEQGVWCVPLRITLDGQKLPLVPWKAFQSRAPTEAEVAEWCARFPYAGAGIPTVNFIVVDTDSPDAIEWVESRGLPKTVMVRTYKGLHYYLLPPAGLTVRNSVGELAPGVDIRGRNGMVVAAGTRNPRYDFTYHYDKGHALGEIDIAECPEWLAEWLVLDDAKRRAITVTPSKVKSFDG